MNELESKNENLMTVKDVATVLGVSYDTINNCVKRIFPNYVRNGVTTRLNETQVACISKELKNNNKVTEQLTFEAGSKVKNTTTDLEIIGNAINAFNALKDLYNQKEAEYKAQIENQQKKLIEQKPKVQTYDNYLSRDKFCNFRDAANYFGTSQTEFMNLLKSKYIYKNAVGEYRAKAEYSEYFTLRPFNKGINKVGQQLMLNLKGLEYFGNIYQKEAPLFIMKKGDFK